MCVGGDPLQSALGQQRELAATGIKRIDHFGLAEKVEKTGGDKKSTDALDLNT